MNKLKKLLKRNFGSFAYFYSYLGNKIFVSVGLSFIVGILDGFGLAMFLPLLQMVGNANQEVDSDIMGNLSFLVEGLNTIGLDLTLRTVLFVILFFFCFKGIIKMIEGFYRVILEQKFIRQIRYTNINLFANFQYKAFVTSDSGRIQNTFTGEVEKVLQAYKNYFVTFQYGVLVFVYLVMAFMSNAQFAVLVTIGGALTNFIFRNIYKTTKALSRSLTKDMHFYQSLLIQKVSNFKYLKASGLIQSFGEKLKATIVDIENKQKRIGILASALTAIREPIVMLVVVSVIIIQVSVFSQELGLIILSLLFFYRSLTFLMAVQNYWNNFLAVSGSLENMTEFKHELLKHQEKKGFKKIPEFKNKLDLIDLSFSYGSVPVLDKVSLSIHKNETVAIVGESGSGKTTLMNILCGLLKGENGKFMIDGVDVESYDMRSFQNRIGYITQEPVIFNDTIFNNVTFWDKQTTETIKKFENALRMASIYDFVVQLPEKENSPLGNNGVMISGGQKQRISIARELYKQVDFLLMDEATSALDSETEKSIQENIDFLKGQYTIIIIAHRLSTIKNADKIIYLNQGKIENMDDFENLKRASSKFKTMVELQEF